MPIEIIRTIHLPQKSAIVLWEEQGRTVEGYGYLLILTYDCGDVLSLECTYGSSDGGGVEYIEREALDIYVRTDGCKAASAIELLPWVVIDGAPHVRRPIEPNNKILANNNWHRN